MFLSGEKRELCFSSQACTSIQGRGLCFRDLGLAWSLSVLSRELLTSLSHNYDIDMLMKDWAETSLELVTDSHEGSLLHSGKPFCFQAALQGFVYIVNTTAHSLSSSLSPCGRALVILRSSNSFSSRQRRSYQVCFLGTTSARDVLQGSLHPWDWATGCK